MMCFLYGGITTVSDGLNLWELMSMAEMFQLKDMMDCLSLHYKAKFAHFFHRVSFSPC